MRPKTAHEQCTDRNCIARFCRNIVEKVRNDTAISAVQVSSDIIAVELLDQCTKKGINVPEDVSIVGFDDLDLASYITPPLTTVRQSFGKIGKLATELIFKRIADKNRKVEKIVIPVELVIRKSSRAMNGSKRNPRQVRHQPISSRKPGWQSSARHGIEQGHTSALDTQGNAGDAADKRRGQTRPGEQRGRKVQARRTVT
jgi:hypothetical protein